MSHVAYPSFVRRALLGSALAAAVAVSSAQAAYQINLTTAGSASSATQIAQAGGAIFTQIDPQPTGSGYIDSFLRVQKNNFEEGYNTDGALEFDSKGGGFTHSLKLSDLAVVNIGGTQYYEFRLDINQQDADPLLDLKDLRLYLGDSASLTGFNTTPGVIDPFGGGHSVRVYDLDQNAGGDGTVTLNYGLNPGSGGGDYLFQVPVSYFQGKGAQYQYVYMYSSFGVQNPGSQSNESNDGFEEWWAKLGQGPSPNPVPAPASALLLLTGVPGLALTWYRRRRAVQA